MSNEEHRLSDLTTLLDGNEVARNFPPPVCRDGWPLPFPSGKGLGVRSPPPLLALVGPHAATQAMLFLAARLAQRGALSLLDGGNRCNAYTLARLLRGLGEPDPRRALERIQMARAFTCYQMAALIEERTGIGTPVDEPGQLHIRERSPLLAVDLLDTFYDESISLDERQRLARRCAAALQRAVGANGAGPADAHSWVAPVVVSLRPPPAGRPDPTGLLDIILSAADLVWRQVEQPGEHCSAVWETAAASVANEELSAPARLVSPAGQPRLFD